MRPSMNILFQPPQVFSETFLLQTVPRLLCRLWATSGLRRNIGVIYYFLTASCDENFYSGSSISGIKNNFLFVIWFWSWTDPWPWLMGDSQDQRKVSHSNYLTPTWAMYFWHAFFLLFYFDLELIMGNSQGHLKMPYSKPATHYWHKKKAFRLLFYFYVELKLDLDPWVIVKVAFRCLTPKLSIFIWSVLFYQTTDSLSL